jgi:hypothetical protein
MDQRAPDYPQLLGSALQSVASVLGFSPDDAVRRILLERADVVSFEVQMESAPDGTIPLTDGRRLIMAGYDTLEAAALAQGIRRSYWRGRRPQRTVDFMERIRLGLPRLGSYVVPVVVPLSIAGTLERSIAGSGAPLALEGEDPYERSVTRTLATAVLAAKAAADESTAGDLRPFQDAVAAGVSANLCAALGSTRDVPSLEGIEVEVNWAQRSDVVAPGASVSISIPRPILARFAEAAIYLGPKETDREELISGKIEHLDHAEGDQEGTIGIRASVDGISRMVWVELPLDDYHRAVRAHDENLDVVCRGTLVAYGPRRMLESLSVFLVQPTLSA